MKKPSVSSPSVPVVSKAARGGKVNKAWLHDHINDPYVKLAAREGYRARAAYKLKESDEFFGLVKPGHVLVVMAGAEGRTELEARIAAITH